MFIQVTRDTNVIWEEGTLPGILQVMGIKIRREKLSICESYFYFE